MPLALPRVLLLLGTLATGTRAADLKIGIIGLDTSHCVVFSGMLNDPANPDHLPGARVVAAFAGGSPDIEHSISRVPGFTTEVRSKDGVVIEPTMQQVVDQSDAIMILSGDGRVHLAQAKIVFPSGKPVFIDKPLGGTLRDALEIVRLAQASHVPLFSGSSLRYTPAVRQLVAEESSIGSVRGAISYGPAVLEPHHPDLYWYGIHPTEALYSVLGPGCETVSRTSTPDTDVVVGTWQGQRTGVLYGIRNQGNSYGLTVFGSKRIINADPGVGYRPFLAAMMEFFRTRVTPVPLTETIEIMTFMEAADESKRRGGAAVSLREVLEMNSR